MTLRNYKPDPDEYWLNSKLNLEQLETQIAAETPWALALTLSLLALVVTLVLAATLFN